MGCIFRLFFSLTSANRMQDESWARVFNPFLFFFSSNCGLAVAFYLRPLGLSGGIPLGFRNCSLPFVLSGQGMKMALNYYQPEYIA